ncbi:MAG: energy transducer TonB [Candidatus Neomarinimicrobiota bacterium]
MQKDTDLKIRRPIIMRTGLVFVLCVIIVILILFPRFEKKNVTIVRPADVLFVLPNIPVTDVKIDESRPPEHPRIPIEADVEDDSIEFNFMPNVDFDDYINRNFPPPPPPPPPTPEKNIPYIIDTEVPQIIGGLNIEYPEMARDNGVEGTVYVQVYVDEKGRPKNCQVKKGVPNTGLDEAAVKAIQKAKFRPGRERDVNVGVNIVIPVVFKLNK